MNSESKVTLIHSSEYSRVIQSHPTNAVRYKLWEGLANAYDLLNGERLRVVAPFVATEDQLTEFHSSEYIDCIKRLKGSAANHTDDNEDEYDDEDRGIDLAEAVEFGLTDDCPVFKGLYEYMLTMAGGSLTAVDALLDGSAEIAINWAGGRHHAKREGASGFCYANDAVLAILRLLDCPRVNKVLYVDIDIHHGDGVEQAFWDSGSVFTLSFHHHEPGFFPGTGQSSDRGVEEGSDKCLNVPLKAGIGDKAFCRVVAEVSRMVFASFGPDVIVIQCGCDTLAYDRLGTFNLTTRGVVACVQDLLQQATPRPVLLLGGGGYHPPSVARCWTALTALAAGISLSEDIPEHEFYSDYRPDFMLHSKPNSGRFDLNSSEDITTIIQQVANSLGSTLSTSSSSSTTTITTPSPASLASTPAFSTSPTSASTSTSPSFTSASASSTNDLPITSSFTSSASSSSHSVSMPARTTLPPTVVEVTKPTLAQRNASSTKRTRDEFEFGEDD